MEISGWTRLWIVGAVIWWSAGALILLPQLPAKNPGLDALLQACADLQATDPPIPTCQIYIPVFEEAYRRAWWDISPQLVLWIAGPLVAWGLWQWVRRGFAPGPTKKY